MGALKASRFKSAELMRMIYTAVPEHGTEFEEILKPEYWAHVGHTMQPGSRIEVMPEDGSYFAELLVRDCRRLWASVALLRKVDFHDNEQIASQSAGGVSYSFQWRGPHAKHAVIRTAPAGNKDVMKEGFATRDQASVWLATHLSDIAA